MASAKRPRVSVRIRQPGRARLEGRYMIPIPTENRTLRITY